MNVQHRMKNEYPIPNIQRLFLFVFSRNELKRQGWDLGRIVDEICRMLSVDPDDLHKKGRGNGLPSAKG